MSKDRRWNVPVSKHLDEQLEEYIDKDAYNTKSEFIRTAVRDRLREENARLEKVASE